jgi:hypothetical protein
MHGLWLRLAETAAGRPAVPGRPGPARPVLAPAFGTEPIAALEREFSSGPATGQDAVESIARPVPAPAATPGRARAEAAPGAPPGRAQTVTQPSAPVGQGLQPAAAPRRDAGAAPPPPAGASGRRDRVTGDPGRGAGTGVPPRPPRPGTRPAGERPSPDPRPRGTGQAAHSAVPLTPAPPGRIPRGTQTPGPAVARAVRLLPADARRAVPPASETALAAPPGRTGSRAPTIEIRIGRIDVRAVRAPAPPAHAAPSSGAPQVSLEDYLRARTAGR